MQTRTTDALPLAPRPNLEQYKKLAKDLLKSADAGAWAAEWLARLGWTRDGEVQQIVGDAQQSRLDSLTGAQLFLARLHGFESWPKFAKHVDALQQTASSVSRFERAADAVVAGDLALLERLVRESPELVRARSTRDHRATLLHYTAANGHEGFRQQTPANAVEIATLLLRAGAEVDALANMYTYPCTTMEMLVSSVHPYKAGVQVALVETLIDFGAAVNGVDDDGSPLMTALAFHYPAAAEALARRGARVDNVVAAAALGRADLIGRFVDDDGRLRPDVPLARGPWPKLTNDPDVHLGYALTRACAFGRDEVVALLLRKGVDPNAGDGELSALHVAAAYGRMDLVRLLLRHGASLEARNRYGGTVLGGTMWFAYYSPYRGVDYPAVLRALLDLGARDDVYPEMKEHLQALFAGATRRTE